VLIGMLGTGRVAQTMATAWSKAGHEVTLGSRDPGSKSLGVPVQPLADVVAGADVVVNATPGAASLETLVAIGAPRFAGKVLIDVATVAGLLADLGWAEDAIIDLGDITTARGVEHYFLLFAALMQAGGPKFNIRVVR
jgi:hypothetical protein